MDNSTETKGGGADGPGTLSSTLSTDFLVAGKLSLQQSCSIV